MDSGEKRKHLGMLIALEVVLIVLTALIFILPVQDYALREYKVWWSNRSPEAWKSFQGKKEKQFEVRITAGSVFALAATGLGFFIIRKRP
jgi:hypothetical protein